MNRKGSSPVAAPMVLRAASVRDLVEFHWLVITHTQHILEDIEGNDGRIEYLRGLALLLITYLHEAAACLNGDHDSMHWCHRLAQAAEQGLPEFPAISGEALMPFLLHGSGGILEDEYEDRLRDLVTTVQRLLPGDLPVTLGPTAQREMLRSLREWSGLAAALGTDIAFLEDRLKYL